MNVKSNCNRYKETSNFPLMEGRIQQSSSAIENAGIKKD